MNGLTVFISRNLRSFITFQHGIERETCGKKSYINKILQMGTIVHNNGKLHGNNIFYTVQSETSFQARIFKLIISMGYTILPLPQ